MPLYFSNFVVNPLRFEVPFAARGYTAVCVVRRLGRMFLLE
jgi:hypothetical protein